MTDPARLFRPLVFAAVACAFVGCAVIEKLRGTNAEDAPSEDAVAESADSAVSLQATVVDPALPSEPRPARAAAVPSEAEQAQVDRSRRDLPPGTVLLEPKPDGFFTRMWRKVFPLREVAPAASRPTWIGTVTLVDSRDGFALIDSQPFYNLTPGLNLISVGQDAETGVLRVSPDRNPPFFIADIVSGRPQRGDRVYSPDL